MQAEKKRLSSLEKQQAIFDALFDADGPMTAYQVHKATGLGMDSLNYHLRAMSRAGILIPLEDGLWTLQAIYYEEEPLQSLETSLELVVGILSSHFVWDFADLERGDEFSVVAANLEFFLRCVKENARTSSSE